MKTALDTVVPPSNISFAGPGKTSQELSQAVAAGVTIEMESAGEAMRIVEAGNRLGIRPRDALRVNPD
jgi:diaminopimelate decarboxylase